MDIGSGSYVAPEAARFEWLVARFLDGLLNEAEDRELVGLVETRPDLGGKLLAQIEIERILIAIGDPQRLPDGEFVDAVRRSVALSGDTVEGERFAQQVLNNIRTRRNSSSKMIAARRSGSRLAVHGHPAQSAAWSTGAMAGLAAAALVAVAVLVTALLPDRSEQRAESVAPAPNPEPAEHRRNLRKSEPAVAESDKPAPVAPATKQDTEELAVPAPKIVDNGTERPLVQPPVVPQNTVVEVKDPEPAVPVFETKLLDPDRPAQEPARVALTPAAAGADELAQLLRTNGVLVLVDRATEKDVVTKSFRAGDTLRVTVQASPSERPMDAGPSGAEVVLRDGTRLWMKEGAKLTLNVANGELQPLLGSGALTAYVAPQPAARPLAICTLQGAEARVLGTVFRLVADAGMGRTNLFVSEGRVAFSSAGRQQVVQASEASYAETGKAPVAPYVYRTRAATLSGIVADKDTGKPIAGAEVYVVPVARRRSEGPVLPYRAACDEQGRYEFSEVPEGNVYVTASTNTGGSKGISGRGTSVRARLNATDKNVCNVALERSVLVVGRVQEGGKILNDYRVRLFRQGGDGLSPIHPLSANGQSGSGAEVGASPEEFSFIAFEGAGRYTALVDKRGSVARVRGGALNDLRPERVQVWSIETVLSPSAVLRGQLQSAGTVPVTDDPDTNPLDPRAPRSVVTLTASNGMVQVLAAEADGSFVFDSNLDTGTYELRTERFGFAPDVRRINLIAGRTNDLAVILQPKR